MYVGQTADERRDDVALMGRIAARDQRAIAALYDRYSGLLYGLVLRVLGNPRGAEDVLEQVFLAAWMCADSYDRTLGSPAAWLVRLALKRAFDRLPSGERRAAMLSLRQMLEEHALER